MRRAAMRRETFPGALHFFSLKLHTLKPSPASRFIQSTGVFFRLVQDINCSTDCHLLVEANMKVLERILSGEFVNTGTLFGAIFYGLVFLGLAWLSLRSLRVALERLEGGLLDRTTVKFLQRMGDAFIWAHCRDSVCAPDP